MGSRWPTVMGCPSRTWSSSSSTRPGSWAAASGSRRPPEVRGEPSSTTPASGSWNGTHQRSWSWRRGTWSAAGSTRRSGRAAGSAGGGTGPPPPRAVAEFARVYQGVEPVTQLVPIQPTAHYAMGGIPTDLETRVIRDEQGTVVPGLYAAGGGAGGSGHGANRRG